MDTTIEKLCALCDEESRHEEAARDSRIKQIGICKKELLGKCFRIKGNEERTVKGEDYERYVCFTEAVGQKNWNRDYYLVAVVVEFDDMSQTGDYGVSVNYQSNDISDWLELIGEAESVSPIVFNDAKKRAWAFLNDKIEKVVEE